MPGTNRGDEVPFPRGQDLRGCYVGAVEENCRLYKDESRERVVHSWDLWPCKDSFYNMFGLIHSNLVLS